jgi:hypothetical protein
MEWGDFRVGIRGFKEGTEASHGDFRGKTGAF